MQRLSSSGAQHVVAHNQRRGITSAGQFNPIHDFTGILGVAGVSPASDMKEFATMISNPGPVRVGYSPDYLDWYWKAYQHKVKASGNTTTGPPNLPSNKMGMGHLMPRVPRGKVRTMGEERMEAAKRAISESSLTHGHMDMFERQSQFPVVHLENASDFHVRELYRALIEPYAVTSQEVWEKALLYTAMLISRQRFYPDTMQYIFEDSGVKGVVLAPKKAADGTLLPDKKAASDVPSAAAAAGKRGIELNPNEEADADIVPTKDVFDYFMALVRIYQIENAAEAAVVLRCHRHSTVAALLNVAQAVTDGSSTAGAVALRDLRGRTKAWDMSFPSLTALVEDDANISLLRCLVFAELNCWGSKGSNPFIRHPNALDHVLRPHAEDISVSLSREAGATVDSARGCDLYPSLPPNIAATIDGRAREVLRLQQNHGLSGRHTAGFNQQLGALLDKEPALYSADRFMQGGYNPRQIRAEIRDQVSRKMLRALQEYDDADTTQVHRETMEVKDDERRSRAAGQWFDGGRNERGSWDLVPPTVVHFVNTLMRDPHIAFLCNFAPEDPIADPYDVATNPKQNTSTPPPATTTYAALLRKAVCEVSETLYGRAREFHLKEERKIQHQKFLVAASVLDGLVAQAATAVIEEDVREVSDALVSGPRASAYRGLGEYRPLSGRAIDPHGCPIPVMSADYERWMAPTPAANNRR